MLEQDILNHQLLLLHIHSLIQDSQLQVLEQELTRETKRLLVMQVPTKDLSISSTNQTSIYWSDHTMVHSNQENLLLVKKVVQSGLSNLQRSTTIGTIPMKSRKRLKTSLLIGQKKIHSETKITKDKVY